MNKTLLHFIMGQLRPVAISLLTALMLVGGGSFAWAQKSLPYEYGFEDNLATAGWTAQGLYSMSGIKQSGSYGIVVHDGSYSFRFYNNSSYANQYLISPELSNSLTGINVSFYYTTNIANYNEQFKIGYSTETSDVSDFTWYEETPTSDTSWHKYERTFPAGTKYIALLYEYVNDNSRQKIFVDDFYIEASEIYKRPKNLTVDSHTTSSATLSWTAGGSFDGETWQIAYSTKNNFDPDTEGVKVDVTENPYTTLSNLVDGVTYYAYVRSNYSDNYSAWCNDELEFKLKTDISLCSDYENKTSANVAVPNYTANESYLTKSQMIYPYSDVSDFAGKYITQLTFYANTSSIDWGTATYDIYLGETTTSAFGYSATFIDWSKCTKVVEGTTLKVSDGKLVINLTTPFLYTGTDSKNLLVGFQQTAVSKSTVSSTWYAKNITSSYPSAAYYNSGSYTYTTGQSYLPYLTISYVSSTSSVTIGKNGFTTFASPRPLDLRAAKLPDGLTAYKASVDGTRVIFTQLDQTVPANTGVLLAGTADDNYNIPMAAEGTTVEGNAFLVNSVGGTFSADDGFTYYGLKKATSSSDKLVFATFNPSTVAIPSNKAYLKVADGGSARQLTCVFDDEATGISATLMNSEERIVNSIYNLAGQRVAQPTKGLYIKNGRKVIVK